MVGQLQQQVLHYRLTHISIPLLQKLTLNYFFLYVFLLDSSIGTI